jgi:Na+/H+ antiporter NhaD/arsenite permease-like protein
VLLVAIFVLGYLAIVLEHLLKLNKSAAALLTGVLCWTAYIVGHDAHVANEQLLHHLGGQAQILFFLLAAMTMVELIDAHDGFDLVTARVRTTNRRKLFVTISVLTFFLSSVLDNLTTAILMMSLARRLTTETDDRMSFGAIVIIAANAGGVWSPIGDVTTTMLWMGQQITTTSVIRQLFLPALASVAVPTVLIGLRMRGHVRRPESVAATRIAELVTKAEDAILPTTLTLAGDVAAIGKSLSTLNVRARTGAAVVTITRDGRDMASPSPVEPLQEGDVLTLAGSPDAVAFAVELLIAGRAPKPTTPLERRVVFFVGLGALLFVPVFKTLTHLPPVMGLLGGLGVLWIVTEIIHARKNDKEKEALSVGGALQRIDAQSVLFFLGILLAISALESDGILNRLATQMDRAIGNVNLITLAIGLSSSVVDNVPLVAASQGMYPLSAFPTDHGFWLFLAYCAGTGGSILIIGSAAGIAVMVIQHIGFGWYLRKISLVALLGYAAGALVYLAM